LTTSRLRKRAFAPVAGTWILIGALAGGAVGGAAFAGGYHLNQAEAEVSHPVDFDRQVLQADRPVLVDFYATWCPPCRALAPTIQALHRDYDERTGQATVLKVDVDKRPDLARRFGVSALPTVMLFVDGKVVGRWQGARPRQTYEQALRTAIASRPKPQPRPQNDKETSMTKPQVTMKGQPVTLTGEQLNVGDKAPDFTASNTDLQPVRLSDFNGKIMLISSVPSLDTPVCDRETRRFNEEAAAFGDEVQVLTVSMDLPFAQKRWCAGAGIENLATLSDHRAAEFGQKYGVLMKDARLLARAIFIVDADGKIRYKQLVNEVTNEPDYDEVLAALRALKKQ